jgi:hypothetical protein
MRGFFCSQHASTLARHHYALFFEARIRLPATSTATGLA